MIEVMTNVIKTVQMTIDETLLEQVDSTSDRLGISRSAFIREALQQAMERIRITELRAKTRRWLCS